MLCSNCVKSGICPWYHFINRMRDDGVVVVVKECKNFSPEELEDNP